MQVAGISLARGELIWARGGKERAKQKPRTYIPLAQLFITACLLFVSFCSSAAASGLISAMAKHVVNTWAWPVITGGEMSKDFSTQVLIRLDESSNPDILTTYCSLELKMSI